MDFDGHGLSCRVPNIKKPHRWFYMVNAWVNVCVKVEEKRRGGKGRIGSVRTLPIHEGTVVATCMSCTHTCISNTFIIYLNICCVEVPGT